MSVFHLYTAYAIVPTQMLRPVHVGFVLFLCFLIFPVRAALPPPRHVVGLCWPSRCRSPSSVYLIQGGDDFTDRTTTPDALGHRLRRRADRAGARGDAPHHRLDHAGRHLASSSSTRCSARSCRAPWTHKGYEVGAPGRPHVHDARRHLRRRGRRLVDADHPVHDLRRLPAVFGRRQVLHRLLVLGDGRQAHRRRPHRGAGLVPARRAVGLRRGDDGDAGLGGLPDAGQGGLRARTRPAACSPRAASARSSRRRCWAPRRS